MLQFFLKALLRKTADGTVKQNWYYALDGKTYRAHLEPADLTKLFKPATPPLSMRRRRTARRGSALLRRRRSTRRTTRRR